jgi:hypothetical protein
VTVQSNPAVCQFWVKKQRSGGENSSYAGAFFLSHSLTRHRDRSCLRQGAFFVTKSVTLVPSQKLETMPFDLLSTL